MVTGTNANTRHHSLEDIKSTAREFVLSSLPEQAQDYKIVADKLDPRLRLASCNSPLQAWYPGHGRRTGNMTVGVRCVDEKSWSIYVPVKVNYYEQVVVAKRPLQRGKIINKDDVFLEKKNISYHADSYFTSVEDVIGRELVHSLQMGYVLGNRNLKLPVLIKRGQQVTLMAQSNNYEIRMEGEAMMDGSAGERIKVRNTRSKRVIEGVVKSSKIIYIE